MGKLEDVAAVFDQANACPHHAVGVNYSDVEEVLAVRVGTPDSEESVALVLLRDAAIECEHCWVVLVDYDNPALGSSE